jgi:hypothetical protein
VDARLLALLEARALRPLDAHFADLLLRHAAVPSPELALAAALVSQHAGDGHVCLSLAARGCSMRGPARAGRRRGCRTGARHWPPAEWWERPAVTGR